jgi:hypothetical protein
MDYAHSKKGKGELPLDTTIQYPIAALQHQIDE